MDQMNLDVLSGLSPEWTDSGPAPHLIAPVLAPWVIRSQT
jgi:hypothetical protein